MSSALDVLTFRFGDADEIPNNPRLPVLIYKHAVQSEGGDAEAIARFFEETWPQHGWSAAWRWGVYDFPHYHSTAHEVLGVYRGHASLRLGHRSGATLVVQAGDVIVLPAGTGHQNLGASSDFHVVGGYPLGQEPDLLRGERSERPAADRRIASVPLPTGDPLSGEAGALMREWK